MDQGASPRSGASPARASSAQAGPSASSRRLAVAHDYVTQRGGAERVVLSVLDAFPGAPLHTSVYDPERTFPEYGLHDVRTTWLNRVPALRGDPRRALPLLAPVISRSRIDADVVVASSSGWAHGFGGEHRTVVYCHNPARWLYQRDDYVAELGRPARGALTILGPSLRRWDRRAARQADRYLANSTSVRTRVRQAYGIDAELLHPPVGLSHDGNQEPVRGLEPGFFLTVARKRGYKNSLLACEVAAAQPGVRLVVVGGLPDGRAWPDNLRGLEGVQDAQLRWLYANARAVIALSHEDFGLTPVEGYAFGTPSVVLRAGGYLDSCVEGTTGVFVDALRHDLVADALRRLAERRWDGAAIRGHSEQFSARAFRDALCSIVDEVSGS